MRFKLRSVPLALLLGVALWAIIIWGTRAAFAEELRVCDTQFEGSIPAHAVEGGKWVSCFGPFGIASGWVEGRTFVFPPASWWFIQQNVVSSYTVFDRFGKPVSSGTISTEPC